MYVERNLVRTPEEKLFRRPHTHQIGEALDDMFRPARHMFRAHAVADELHWNQRQKKRGVGEPVPDPGGSRRERDRGGSPGGGVDPFPSSAKNRRRSRDEEAGGGGRRRMRGRRGWETAESWQICGSSPWVGR